MRKISSVVVWILSILFLLSACNSSIPVDNPQSKAPSLVEQAPSPSQPNITPTEVFEPSEIESTSSAPTPQQTNAEPTIGTLTVHYIDVGQGDSEFIELPNGETMLIDAGNEENGQQIVSYMNDLGYDDVNYLIATHPHADHIGGMAYVVNNMGIGYIYMPRAEATTQTFENLLTTIKNKGLSVLTARAGVSILSTDNLKVEMLAPNSSQYDDLNNYSAVIKITYKSNSFLFMGDAEELSENEITDDVNVDILKVGHHGSNSSSGIEFIKKVSPTYAIISCGKDNSYGHPTQETLDKLESVGASIFRTDLNSTIVVSTTGSTYNVDTVRNDTTASPLPSPQASTPPPKIGVIISSVDKKGELVTIKNTGSADVDLSGWVLVSVKGNQRFTFPSYILKAGDTVKIASNDAIGDLYWTSANVWNNSENDPAELYDQTGNLISTF